MKNDVVLGIAEKYKITPANVLISFQVNTPNVNGEEYRQVISALVKSADIYLKKSWRSPSPPSVSSVSLLFSVFYDTSLSAYNHVQSENLQVVDLAEEDIAELKKIDKTAHFRVCHPSWTGWGNLGFTD